MEGTVSGTCVLCNSTTAGLKCHLKPYQFLHGFSSRVNFDLDLGFLSLAQRSKSFADRIASSRWASTNRGARRDPTEFRNVLKGSRFSRSRDSSPLGELAVEIRPPASQIIVDRISIGEILALRISRPPLAKRRAKGDRRRPKQSEGKQRRPEETGGDRGKRKGTKGLRVRGVKVRGGDTTALPQFSDR